MKTSATIAFILAFLMAVLNLAPSYSQLADTVNEPLLNLFLGAIIIAFMLRKQQMDVITAIMFIGVNAFSVNSSLQWIVNLHLLFTGLAIISAHLGVIFQAKNEIFKLSAYISMAVSFSLFSMGYFLDWYSVGTAELIVSLIVLLPFYKRINL